MRRPHPKNYRMKATKKADGKTAQPKPAPQSLPLVVPAQGIVLGEMPQDVQAEVEQVMREHGLLQ